jgi:hypothetical protein
MKVIDCKERCGGKVGTLLPVFFAIGPIQDGFEINGSAYFCDKCGRLHWGGGTPVADKHKNAAFVICGEGILKNDKGEVVDTFCVMGVS